MEAGSKSSPPQTKKNNHTQAGWRTSKISSSILRLLLSCCSFLQTASSSATSSLSSLFTEACTARKKANNAPTRPKEMNSHPGRGLRHLSLSLHPQCLADSSKNLSSACPPAEQELPWLRQLSLPKEYWRLLPPRMPLWSRRWPLWLRLRSMRCPRLRLPPTLLSMRLPPLSRSHQLSVRPPKWPSAIDRLSMVPEMGCSRRSEWGSARALEFSEWPFPDRKETNKKNVKQKNIQVRKRQSRNGPRGQV